MTIRTSSSVAKRTQSVTISVAKLIKYCVGIDVSKAELVVCFRSIDTEQHSLIKGSRTFDNTKKGFVALVSWIEKFRKEQDIPLLVVMEATGVYHEAAAYFLVDKGYPLSIVLPNKAKKYMQSLGLKSKNDRIDASGLAQMGCDQRLALWQKPTEETMQLRDLTRYLEFLHTQMTDCRNRLESYEHRGVPTDMVVKQLKGLIKTLEKQVKEVHHQITQHIKSHPQLADKVALVTSINGVGELTAAVIISEMNDFQLIENQRQLVSFCGYDVVENQSGKRSGKTKISKKGNAHVRRILYMPVLSVVRLGVKPFKDLFDRVLERTGVKMKAYVAVQKKLLTTIYTLYKKNEFFDPQYSNKKQSDVQITATV
jgi:transposase